MKQLLVCAAFASMIVTGFASAAETDYPARPIRLVVGYPAGGQTDVLARIVAKNLGDQLGKQVIVENTGGAGGTIGALNVARATPDGYTLLMSVEATQTRAKVFYPKVAYDQLTSFTLLRKMAKQRAVLVVNPNFPAKSVAELVAYAKARPKELNYGGTLGTTSHIGGTIFDKLYGTQLTFVSYAGGNQPITDLLSGTTQVGFFTESTVAEYIKAGSLRALAVLAPERSLIFPDLATIEEAGGKAFDISAWFGVAGPAGLPPAVVQRLMDALNKVSDSPEFASHIQFIGAVPIKGSNPQNFAADVAKEVAYWGEWAKENKPD